MSKANQAEVTMMNKEIISNKRIVRNKKVIGTRAKTYKIGLGLIMAFLIMAGWVLYAHAPATAVNLGSAGNYVILAETTITTTGTTQITGDIGLSPAAASSFTGFSQVLDGSGQFSTSSLVTGRLYAADYTDPTPATLTTAVTDMGTAYTTANSQSTSTPLANFLNIGTPAGTLPAQTLPAGVYTWTSPSPNVVITGNIILSGGPSDVWVFQIPGTLDVATSVTVTMSGGATSNNVFWVVGGQTTIHAGVTFNGIILDYTSIAMQSGATLTGRALAQAAVTLIGNTIGIESPNPTPTPTPTASPTPTPTPTPTASPIPKPVGGEILPINILSVLLSQYSAVIVLLVILSVSLGLVLVRKRTKCKA
jgi:hypothetical protein